MTICLPSIFQKFPLYPRKLASVLPAIAEFHAKALAEIPGAELVASYSRRDDAVSDLAIRHGGRAHTSFDTFLTYDGLVVVAICMPSSAHLEPEISAAQADK